MFSLFFTYFRWCDFIRSLDQSETRDCHLDIEQILYQLGVITDEPRAALEPKVKVKRTASTGKGSPGGEEERLVNPLAINLYWEPDWFKVVAKA